jgi:nickel superoxide dismutase
MKFADRLFTVLDSRRPPRVAHAHCDIPCGIYDPHNAQLAALTVIRMVQLIQALPMPDASASKEAIDMYGMQISRYTAVKEEHAKICEHELTTIWTDYFKPEHVQQHSNLPDIYWKTAKLTSTVKQTIDMDAAQQLLAGTQQFAEIFWATKNVQTHRQPSNQGAAGGELVYPNA